MEDNQIDPEEPDPESKALVPQSGKNSLKREDIPEERRITFPTLDLPGTTEEQKKLINNAMMDVVLFGARESAMVCRGYGNKDISPDDPRAKPCPYIEKCFIARHKGPLPLGDECPIEMNIVETWAQAYLKEMGSNPHDSAVAYDIRAARHMAALELQIHRATWGEAMNPVLEQKFEGMGPGKLKMTILSGNFNTDYKERALKWLMKFGQENIQGRATKVKLTKSGLHDKSKHAAEVTQRMADLKQVQLTEIEERTKLSPDGVLQELSKIQRFAPPKEAPNPNRPDNVIDVDPVVPEDPPPPDPE